eukprot:TRINITY_DN49686_c0_g1_i1.p1 TRINITY_DN49686_c0_g1~~TRINITY_DN49686_c0_g1_i1.p1  ORF type:complete len:391 (+),score=74.62 TRINITY_DN49686_c0_g1_i1:36-1208(+)
MTLMSWSLLTAVLLAWLLSPLLFQPELDSDLNGQVAIVTGGSRGVGRGIAHSLCEAGAVVYVTGRSLQAVQQACATAPGPGRCIPRAVDSANDTAVAALFEEVSTEHGQLHILVNNAYSGIEYWGKAQLLGRPFWETPMRLFDEVFQVGVRAHYLASQLAVPLMMHGGRSIIVNTNSPGCVLYALNVPYGMGKCAVDKMSADMSMELGGRPIDVLSWWAGAPMMTEQVLAGSLDGTMRARRGMPPGTEGLVPGFSAMYHTALSSSLMLEGRSMVALLKDQHRGQFSGMAVSSAMVSRRYGLVDERGIRPPSVLSLKYHATYLVPWLWGMAQLPEGTQASLGQRLLFNWAPDCEVPQWVFKVLSGVPLSVKWPDVQGLVDLIRPATAPGSN